jgi:hypothetical protein
MTKHYVISQSSLRTAHRSPESELYGNVQGQQETKQHILGSDRNSNADNEREDNNRKHRYSVKPRNSVSRHEDCPRPADKTQIEKFYAKYGNWSAR